MRLGLILCVLFTAAWCEAQEGIPEPPASDTSIPRTVDEAVKVLKTEWLSEEHLGWILRNPKDHVVISLHLPFGTGVRNTFKLWGGNPELLASCGTHHAEECSSIIFERLWESVREDADPELVRKLDCQFRLIEGIQIEYKGFYALRIGEVLKRVQEQIDRQLATLASELGPTCETSLRLQAAGKAKLNCWVRAEFSEDRRDPVSLERFFGWFSWRNGFRVFHSPPQIELVFHEKCAWPEQPVHFLPPQVRDR